MGEGGLCICYFGEFAYLTPSREEGLCIASWRNCRYVCLSPGVEGGKGISSLQQPLSAQPWIAISLASLAWPGALTTFYLQEQGRAPTPWRGALQAPQVVSGNSAAETSPDVEHHLSCSENPSLCPTDLVLCRRCPCNGSGPRLISPSCSSPWSIKSQSCPLTCPHPSFPGTLPLQ